MNNRKNTNRMDRVNEELKKEISIVIDQHLKNPNITGLISVTKVKTSPDLRFAKVYISLLNSKSKKKYITRIKKCLRVYKNRNSKKSEPKIYSRAYI